MLYFVTDVFFFSIAEFSELDLDQRICPEARPGEDDLLGESCFLFIVLYFSSTDV